MLHRAMTALGLLFLAISLYGFYRMVLIEPEPYPVVDISASSSGKTSQPKCSKPLGSGVKLEIRAPAATYLDDSVDIEVDATLDSAVSAHSPSEMFMKLSGAGLL